jgi:DNA replication initiation complex subunit (GINS family)
MATKTTKAAEDLEELKVTLRRWQHIEDQSVAQTSAIMARTHNPLIKLVMEIIRQDSAMHKRVQQAILDSLEKQAFSLTPEELGDVWDLIEKHIVAEKETIELAEKARKNSRMFAHRYLLSYLAEDEQKHDHLLDRLEDFKRNLYPYA